MRRNTFILTALAASATFVIPALYCRSREKIPKDTLAWPEELAEITDENTIREIGKQYQKQYPLMKTKEELKELLMTAHNSQLPAPSNDPDLAIWLKDKIHQDFSSFRTIIVNGWVISITEVQQCTLFSLL